MTTNIEVFYGDNLDQKINLCQTEFQKNYLDLQNQTPSEVDPIFYKALNRVLNDDYKKNPELVRQVLKNIHILFLNYTDEQKLEVITENSIDGFLWTTSKILVWEFKRIDRIYKRYCEVKQENKEASAKVIKAMNLNIQKQCKIFTLVLMMYVEYWNFLDSFEFENSADKKKEFRDNLLNFNIINHLVKFYDYEDQNLLKTITSFLIEICDKNVAVDLINRKILQRLYRFLHSQQLPSSFVLLNKLFSFEECRKKLGENKFFVKGVILALERNQIGNALVLLNLISLTPEITPLLVEFELDIYLLNLVSLFFKKDDSIIEKKRVLWNLLINVATIPDFANSFLKFKNFKIIFEFLIRTHSDVAFKFIENVFYFSNDYALKAKYGEYTEPLLNYLETSDPTNYNSLSSCLTILSDIYNIKERKAITFMMKILKKQNTHPNIFISSFQFLNKTLYSPNLHKELLSKSVIEYVINKFIEAPIVLEDEVKFQLLFFIYNLNQIKNSRVPYETFLGILEGFENVNIRFLGLVLNIFDLYIANYIQLGQEIEDIRNRKIEFFTETIICLNENLTPSVEYDDDYADGF